MHSFTCIPAGNTLQLTPCVTVIVLGFFSADDHVKKEHFNFEPNDPQLNFIEGNELETMQFLIEHFSQLGNTVLDITGLQGVLRFNEFYFHTYKLCS